MKKYLILGGMLFVGVLCRAENAKKPHGDYDEKSAPHRNVHAGQNLSPAKIARFSIDGKKKAVGICYSNWFDLFLGRGTASYSLEKILEYPTGEEPWGPVQSWHLWGEPAIGYYRSSDPFVIAKHLEQIQAAGIDFIVFDNTNMSDDWDEEMKMQIAYRPYAVFLETMRALINQGKKVPRIVVWSTTESAMDIYNLFYKLPEYKNLFVHWEADGQERPFMIVTAKPDENINEFRGSKELREQCEIRFMWGLKKDSPNIDMQPWEWEYLSRPPQHLAVRDGRPEHMSATTAMQGNWINIPNPKRLGRRGGQTFQDQWRRIFEKQPPVVTVAWWNEWGVQRRYDEEHGNMFIDNYDREFSRDIEPMKGGHGDAYYRMLCGYVAAYKAGEKLPENLLEKDLLRK